MPALRSSWTLILGAAAIGVPAVILRLAGVHLDPGAAVAVFGLGILTAAFLIGTGAEASQRDIPAALSVAVIALIAVLPEYAVDLLLAFEAASDVTGAASELDNCLDPGTSREMIQERAAAGGNTETCKGPLALANMTGANRLLLGVGWATVVLLFVWRKIGFRRLIRTTALASARGIRSIAKRGEQAPAAEEDAEPTLHLPGGIGLDIGILALATLYSFVIVAKGAIDIIDTVILGLLFFWYVIRLTRSPVEEPELEGPAAAIGGIEPTWQRRIVVGLVIGWSAAVIISSAEPFVHGLEELGRQVGISEFFLIQWLAPLASESPEFLAALYLVWRGSAGMGINMLVSSKVNQWTLLIASLPLGYIAGGGGISGLDLGADGGRQTAELFLTAAQSAFGVMLILDRSLSARAAFALLFLFLAQLFTQFAIDHNAIRIGFGVAYLVLAAILAFRTWREAPKVAREVFRRP